MFKLNNKTLALDMPFTAGEGDEAIQYPANWLRLASPEERAAVGITEEVDAPSYDDRFYWGVDHPKDLDTLKETQIAQVKQIAGSMLSSTDWKIVRQVELAIAVDEATLTKRAAIRDESNRLETAIVASTTVEELIEVISTSSWPKDN